jgi:hypothetical protein
MKLFASPAGEHGTSCTAFSFCRMKTCVTMRSPGTRAAPRPWAGAGLGLGLGHDLHEVPVLDRA